MTTPDTFDEQARELLATFIEDDAKDRVIELRAEIASLRQMLDEERGNANKDIREWESERAALTADLEGAREALAKAFTDGARAQREVDAKLVEGSQPLSDGDSAVDIAIRGGTTKLLRDANDKIADLTEALEKCEGALPKVFETLTTAMLKFHDTLQLGYEADCRNARHLITELRAALTALTITPAKAKGKKR